MDAHLRPDPPMPPHPPALRHLRAHPGRPLTGAARLAVVLAALALVLSACGATGAVALPSSPPASPSPSSAAPSSAIPSAAAFPATLTDDEGRSVTLAAEPQRIVSLTPAVTETLFALGAGPKVVATTDFDDYPPEAVALPDVASYTSVDVEKIVGLQPDLVIAGGNGFNDPDAIARLRSLGIPVLVTYAPDIPTVLSDIMLVGQAAGRPDEAVALTAAMQTRIEAVKEATTSLPKPRTFYELDATKDIYGPADSSFLQQMLGLAGADAITTGSPTVFSIPLERLVQADPELILLGDAAYGVTPDAVAARPGWGSMTAVKDGAIRPVNDVIVTRPGPRIVDGLEALAVAIHPELASRFPPTSASPASSASAPPSATP